MSNRSSSGVRNLRAMFEANQEPTTSPSRGRSPSVSESVGSSSSRPISKVRASFVAVERSGQFGPQLGLRKMSTSNSGDASAGGDGASDTPEPESNSSNVEPSKVNGHIAANSQSAVSPVKEVGEQGTLDGSKDATASSEHPTTSDSLRDDNPSANPDKPVSAVEDETANLLPADPKDANIVANGNTLTESAEDQAGGVSGLASKAKSNDTSKQSEAAALSSSNEHSTQADTQDVSAITNEGASGQLESQEPSGGAVESTSEPASSRPSAIATNVEAPSAEGQSAAKASVAAAKSPKKASMAKTPSAPSRQPLAKTASPKQSIQAKEPSKNTSKEPAKAPIKKPSRASLGPNGHTGSGPKSKPASASSTGPSAGEASTSSFVKPRPKSPTRPVRLPQSATASTASSAAKLGGSAPSRSPSRVSNATTNFTRKPSTLNKDRPAAHSKAASSTRASLQNKPSRTSLPANARIPERPKSRASNVPTDDSFLARMMRPTASSASKTHEKVEVKSPPQKGSSVKPNRKSEGAEQDKSKRSKSPTAGALEQAPEAETSKVAPAPQEEVGETTSDTLNEALLLSETVTT
ncbi:hypothetical protein MMC20_004627 [Loxospora ochrophaea]|nr:hypothetical protein [Loxospora ochrophaea]